MSNPIVINVADPDGLLAGLGAGALIRLQSAATQTGTYGNVTTIAIVAGDHEYSYEDLAGLDATWYKVRFEDALGSYPKDYGAPFQANDATSAYASDAAFRTFIRSSDIDADALTRKLALEAAARAIDRACGRTFRLAGASAARTFQVGLSTSPAYGWFGLNRYRYAVDTDDFFDASAVTVGFDATGNGSYTTTTTAFRPMPSNAPQKAMPYRSLLFDIGVIPPVYALGQDGVQVTTTWGWNAIPSSIVMANMIQASRYAKRRDSVFGVAGSDEMGGAIRLLPKLDPDLETMLAPYRLEWGNQ